MMYGGIYLGGYYTGSRGKVPTFAFDKNSASYYYCRVRFGDDTRLKKLTAFGSEDGMYHAAPVILAFWGE